MTTNSTQFKNLKSAKESIPSDFQPTRKTLSRNVKKFFVKGLNIALSTISNKDCVENGINFSQEPTQYVFTIT
jgi:hypothetical protein